MDLEYKELPVADLKFVDDAGSGLITGHGAVIGNWDRQKDMILPGAFGGTLQSLVKDGFIAWGHDWKGMPLGTISEAHEDPYGLAFSAEFHSTPEAQSARTVARERLERGKSMGLSIGYKVNPGGAQQTKDGRLLKSITVHEISLVLVPANELAGVAGVKSDEEAEFKPFTNFHACRLKDPGEFESGSFRTMTRKHDGKPYEVVMGHLKGEDTMAEQTYHYPKSDWTAAAAKAHCDSHDGIEFAPASGSDGKALGEEAYQPQARRMHEPFTGTHSHEHSAMGGQGGDQMHTHEHIHRNDANHAHAHKSAFDWVDSKEKYDALSGEAKLAIYYELLDAGLLDSDEAKADWTAAYVNTLEDDCFAAIESGGSKDNEGKTTPRSLRHYPHHPKGEGAGGTGGTVDAPHLRNALARVANSDNYQGGKGHLEAHANKLGIGDRGKNDDPDELKTFAEESYTALAAVEGFVDRARSLADLRAKAGRTISSSNRARLSDLKDQLMACCSTIDGLMTMSDPQPKGVDATAEYMEYLRLVARDLGVPV